MEARQKTMLGVITRISATVCLGYITGFSAQLPPEMLVDKYLLQATMLSEEKNYKGALEAMDRIVTLQKEHNLALPEDFPFHYAQTALAAGSVQAAIDSANRYLSSTSRESKHYREALELLVGAELKLKEPAPDPVGFRPVKADLEPQPTPPPSALAQKTPVARPAVDCRKWNTKKFFRKATVEDVTACLAAGAKVKTRKRKGWKGNPLLRAAIWSDDPKVIEALIAAGADPNARGHRDDTPLHWAVLENDNPQVAMVLINARADLDAQLKHTKRTPLHCAADSENSELVKALVDAGANLMIRNSSGKTPLQVARKEHRKVLRDAWASLSDSQKAAQQAQARRQETQSGDSSGLAALVAGVTGAAIGAAGGLDAATATELGAAIGGSVLAGEAGGSSGTNTASGGSSGDTGATAGGGTCLVPGYPNPPGGVANLGFSWCPASVDLQVRAFALQAAGAQCAIATGSSSTPEQIEAGRGEIRAACDRLAALGQDNCQCPPDLR